MTNFPVQPQLALASYNNQSLFSDHYLDEILRWMPGWQESLPAAADFLTWLRQLYAQEQAHLDSYNESQLEEHWFRPIFHRLGHVWEGQASIPGLKGNIKKPDYVFFTGEAARKAAAAHQNTPAYVQAALAAAEVKKWDVNLSKKTGSQPLFDDQNPMFQIDTYLSLSGLAWGIVSNGRLWRLVHRDTSRTLEIYFEMDLLAALHAANDTAALAAAAYFWRFFSQASFQPDAQGRVFLADALEQSRAYAVALEADLRDNAYRALEQLIIGFFAGDATLDKTNENDRAQVYQNSLYLLYRLLFLFYGESRALLPMRNATYKEEYSLWQLTRTIDQTRNTLDSRPATGRRLWARLRELCRVIAGSDPQLNADLGVPRYNGGLFDPQQHPFLEQHFVGDRYLARAIDYLAFRRIVKDGGLPAFQAVDYRTLDVRQLGSIYEGMLEYKVTVAETEMVTVSRGGVETWLPLAQKGKAKTLAERRQPGDLYLTNDKGERKATGSYYTPDYIVEYIVAHTLGPLVAAARERAQAGPANETAARFVAEILRLNVLDPAMGSGHFLVEATNYLARALATDERVTVPGAPVPGTPAPDTPDTDLLYWKRRVVEACIYGVDKNPMAVELAKLSLWLKTAAADKPLTFLDHHLRHGDSLIGAWLADLERPPAAAARAAASATAAQEALFDDSAFSRDIGLAVHGVAVIERLPTEDIADVHAKEDAWRDVQRAHLARWQRLADLWVSGYFGNEMTPAAYRALAARLQGGESLLSEAQAAAFLNHPAASRQTNPALDYFHWQLAFPEVFFDEYGRSLGENAGFDAVIGNPPYVDIKGLNKPLVYYLFTTYSSMMLRINVFAAFLENALLLTKDVVGSVSLIIPSAFLTQVSYSKLRKIVLEKCQLEHVVRLPNELFGGVAGEVKVDTCVVLIRKTQPNSSSNTLVLVYDSFERVTEVSPETADRGFHVRQEVWQANAEYTINLVDTLELEIIKTVRSNSQPLESLCEFCLGLTPYDKYRGHTEEQITNKVFHADSQLDSTYKKLLVSGDVGRYLVLWNGKEWIKYGEWLAAPREPRFFRQERILVQQIIDWSSMRIFVGWTDEELYNTQNQFNLVAKGETNLKFVLAILASKLISYFHRAVYLDVSLQRFQKILIKDAKNLPIRKIDFASSQVEREAALTVVQSYYQQAVEDYKSLPDFCNQAAVGALLAWVDGELAAGRNDTVHDWLAFLAERMIEMNRARQAALEAFWLDVEGAAADARTFALLRKGKQAQSLYKDIPAARPFVNADSRSSITLDASLDWNEEAFKGFVKALAGSVSGLSKLVQAYRAHAAGVAALNGRLAGTDWLIDQTVYKLYGLTAAEIAVVEGGS